jgi:exosortase/archaeosortase family protein
MIAGGSRSTYPILLASACALLVALPFVTTFNDFLTAGAMRLGIAGPVQIIADGESRMAVSILSLLGIHAGVAGNGYLVIKNAAGHSQTVFISWNCIGWQSLVLLGLSLTTGLRGNYSWMARVQVILIGALGTIFVNLFRVTAVCLLAVTVGYVPAILFHDYGGTLLIIGWLFAFWALAYRWILGSESLAEPAGESAA